MSWQYFSDSELMCRCCYGKAEMEPNFMKKLIVLREYVNFPFAVTSAYRCFKTIKQ